MAKKDVDPGSYKIINDVLYSVFLNRNNNREAACWFYKSRAFELWKRLTNDDALTHHKWFASQRLGKLLCHLEPYAPIIKWDRKCQSHYRHVINRVHDLSVYHSLTVSSLKYSFNDMISRRYGGSWWFHINSRDSIRRDEIGISEWNMTANSKGNRSCVSQWYCALAFLFQPVYINDFCRPKIVRGSTEEPVIW